MSAKLGDILISRGVIDSEKLIAALSDQRAFGGKLGRTLVELGYVSEDDLMIALSEQLGLDVVDLDGTEVPSGALRCLPVDACERYGIFPLSVNEREHVLRVATAEPDREALQEVARICGYTLEPALASMSSIERAIRRYYFGENVSRRKLGDPLSAIPDIPLAAPRPRSVPDRTAEAQYPEAMLEPDDEDQIGIIAPDGASQDALDELKTLVIRLERTINAQSRAFRALVDLLQDKGVVRRGELGQRAARK
jgi:type IV pilus assembly protein PilB